MIMTNRVDGVDECGVLEVLRAMHDETQRAAQLLGVTLQLACL
jgi:hypothetical protein